MLEVGLLLWNIEILSPHGHTFNSISDGSSHPTAKLRWDDHITSHHITDGRDNRCMPVVGGWNNVTGMGKAGMVWC